MNESPNYYSIIPANVRYCEDLSAQEKLLYSEITALTNYKGYCWATNNYFANLYKLSKETISRQISKLAKYGFIYIEIIYFEDTKQVKERRIYLSQPNRYNNINDINTPIDENVNTPIDENVNTPIDENVNTPIDENVKDNKYICFNKKELNTTSMNTSNPILSNRFKEGEEKEKTDEIGYDKIPNQSVNQVNKKRQKNKESLKNAPIPQEKHLIKPSTPKYNYNDVLEIVKTQINYDYILMDNTVREDLLDEILHTITATICNEYRDGYITMGEERVSAELVKSVFFKLNKEEIEYYAKNFNRQTDPITKTAAYIRTSLYRNHLTTGHHYTNRVHIDMPQLAEKKIKSRTV